VSKGGQHAWNLVCMILNGYSGENGQWLCRESGRRYAVKKAAIPVKTARV